MKIGLVAGEASGDLLGAGLIAAIKERFPDARFEGVAGPAMTAAGCEQWEPAESLAVMGLIEPLAHIPRLLRLRRELARRWIESPPDVFVGIDAPDFNLGLEKKLRRAGVRTAHYVSPSIWAWRPGRVKKVRKAVDKVLCILPFEPPLYERNGVAASFVGHPRASAPAPAVDTEAARRELGLGGRTIVAVLPGSRTGEVSRLGGPFAHAAAQLAEARPELHFVTPLARPDLRALVESQLEAAAVADRFTLLDGQSNLAMAAADVVLLASGTAVLEAALLGRPSIAAYKVAPLTHFLVRTLGLVKLTHYTLPNLLTDEPLVPEFIQHDATPEALAGAVGELLDDPQRRRFIRDEFAKLKRELALDADQLAAESIIELARR